MKSLIYNFKMLTNTQSLTFQGLLIYYKKNLIFTYLFFCTVIYVFLLFSLENVIYSETFISQLNLEKQKTYFDFQNTKLFSKYYSRLLESGFTTNQIDFVFIE